MKTTYRSHRSASRFHGIVWRKANSPGVSDVNQSVMLAKQANDEGGAPVTEDVMHSDSEPQYVVVVGLLSRSDCVVCGSSSRSSSSSSRSSSSSSIAVAATAAARGGGGGGGGVVVVVVLVVVVIV